MYFAPISPTAYLDRYSGRSNVQMCVGCWAVKHPEYYEWYKQRRLAGDFVFLDNGAYEGELVAPDEYARLIRDLNPQVYTLPDKIDDEVETQRLQMDFLKQAPRSSLAMRVLQSSERDYAKWLEMFCKFQNLFKWIALPRALKEHRASIAVSCCTKRHPGIHIHAFGWIGSIVEIDILARHGVDTMDSAGPVWRGLLGWNITTAEDLASWPNPPFEVDNPHRVNHELAGANLSKVFRAAVGL